MWLALFPALVGMAIVSPAVCHVLGWRAGHVFAVVLGALTIIVAVAWPPLNNPVHLGWNWIASLGLAYTIRLDGLAYLFALLVLGIGTLVFLYASAYLAHQPHCDRFYFHLWLFLSGMLGIALADNLYFFFVAWELTSITSYFLIGYEHRQAQARRAALQALLTTTMGGLALLTAIILLGLLGAGHEFSSLAQHGDTVRTHRLYPLILALIGVAALSKSAQFPFHFWLPNAMAAPTPVSAYLHSATMVNAGIFLLMRMTAALAETAGWRWLLLSLGTTSCLLAGFLTLLQTDAKRMLAYSTVAALGLITMLLAWGHEPAVAAAILLLLIAHALYKAALFLIVGALDHAVGTRNVEQWRGLGRYFPSLMVGGVTAALAMVGLPPSLSFLAKEKILMLVAEDPLAIVVVILLTAVFTFTALRIGIRPFLPLPLTGGAHFHPLAAPLLVGPIVLGVSGLLLILLQPMLEHALSFTAPSIAGMEPNIQLRFWHGFGWPLAFSAFGIVGGVCLYVLRARLAKLKGKIGNVADAIYDAGVAFAFHIARWQTRVWQHGRLTIYLATLLVAVVIVMAPQCVDLMRTPSVTKQPGQAFFFERLLAIFIAAAALAVPGLKSRFGSVAALGMTGYGVALVFVLYGAPDLAITQFLVETSMLILFVFVFQALAERAPPLSHPRALLAATVGAGVGLIMALLAGAAVREQPARHVAHYYLANSWTKAHGQNVVNVILVDFRALDTVGEVTVLAIAAIGIFAIARHARAKGAA